MRESAMKGLSYHSEMRYVIRLCKTSYHRGSGVKDRNLPWPRSQPWWASTARILRAHGIVGNVERADPLLALSRKSKRSVRASSR